MPLEQLLKRLRGTWAHVAARPSIEEAMEIYSLADLS
jgi:hypothetical protein